MADSYHRACCSMDWISRVRKRDEASHHGYFQGRVPSAASRSCWDLTTLLQDERNFLIPPPEDTNFQFDLNAYSQSAQAALKEDKNLSHLRFVLVPQQ